MRNLPPFGRHVLVICLFERKGEGGGKGGGGGGMYFSVKVRFRSQVMMGRFRRSL